MASPTPQFWDDDKVFSLSAAGVLLFNCMICGPQITNLPGLYRAEPLTFYHPLRCFPHPEVESAFEAILESGLAIFDRTSKLLRLPKCYRHHPIPNANMIIGWRKTWDRLPNSHLKFDHLDSLWRLARQRDAAAEAYHKHFGKIRRDSDPADYRIGGWVPFERDSKPGIPGRHPTHGTLPPDPTGQDLQEIDRDHLSISGEGAERETGTGTGTGTKTTTSTRLQPFQPLDALEGLPGREGLEGLAASAETGSTGEGLEGYKGSQGLGGSNGEQRTGRRVKQQPRRESDEPDSGGGGFVDDFDGAPGAAGGTTPEGAPGVGRGGNVVDLPVSPGSRRDRKRE